MPKAYTYLIVHKASRHRYIGVRWANAVSPREDLGREYFTSSKLLGPRFEANPGDYLFRVLAEFDEADDAKAHEVSLLHRYNAKASPNYINQSNGGTWGGREEVPVLAWKDGEIAAHYESASKAARSVGCHPAGILHACVLRVRHVGGREKVSRTAAGFKWTYALADTDRYESESVETVGLEEAAGLIDEGPEAAMIEREELAERLDMAKAALDSMTEKQREAFVLVRIGGKTFRDAADALGVDLSSVRDRIRQADRKLTWAEACEDLDVTPNATAQRLEGADKKLTLYEARDRMGLKWHNSVVNYVNGAEKKIEKVLQDR